jgi:hypothetical protein
LEKICFSRENIEGTKYFALFTGEGKVTLPIMVGSGNKLKITASDNTKVKFGIFNGQIEVAVTPEISGKKLSLEVFEK